MIFSFPPPSPEMNEKLIIDKYALRWNFRIVLNSRSLTVVSAEDLEEPLTPSHFIVGHGLKDAPDLQRPDHEDFEVDSDVTTKQAKYLKKSISNKLFQ